MQTSESAAEPRTREIKVSVRLLGSPDSIDFRLPETATLLELLQEGAAWLGQQLLPSAEAPFDRLRNVLRHDEVGPPIADLEQELGDVIKEHGTTRDFAIELVLSFHVNARWAIAPRPSLTPREIVALDGIKLDPTEYTLYLPGSGDPLPIDTPITITRGMLLEAQRDGKYGEVA